MCCQFSQIKVQINPTFVQFSLIPFNTESQYTNTEATAQAHAEFSVIRMSSACVGAVVCMSVYEFCLTNFSNRLPYSEEYWH